MSKLRKCIVNVEGKTWTASFHRWCDTYDYVDTGHTICENLKIFDKFVVTKAIIELPNGTIRVVEIEQIKFITNERNR